MRDSSFVIGPQMDLSIFTGTMVDMTWQEIKRAVESNAVVLLPVGMIEEHGPHMDLSPDVRMATVFCRGLVQKLQAKGMEAVIAPPFYWGISPDCSHFPGTFSVRPETMKGLLVDIFTSLESWGFKNLFVANAHGDPTHVAMIEAAIDEVRNTLKMRIDHLGNLAVEVENPPAFPPAREGAFAPDYHAGSIETAAVNTFFPQIVNTVLAKTLKPQVGFGTLGHRGDPASFELEKTIIEYFHADTELDALKIQAVLNGKAASLG